MNKELLKVMQEQGELSYPKEACGLVVALPNGKSLAIPCVNASGNPTQHFTISATDYAGASKQGAVIGIWHTHCNISPQPSDADKAACEMFGIPWYIVSVYKNEVGVVSFSDMTVTTPSGFEMPYLGRPYVPGVFDCYNLLMDYYKREFGVILNDYPRIKEDGTFGIANFSQAYQDEGFVLLIGEQPKVGDFFLIQTVVGTDPDHVAIYLGDEMIMHHNTGRLSKRDPYGGYWAKHTTHHLRHKTQC